MTDAVVLAPLLLAAVLLTSGVAKLRAPGTLADGAADLGVPAALRRPAVLRAVPWAEILLGLAVVVVPGPVPPALVALLMLGYTVLVGRAVRSGVAAECGCFGVEELVGPRTLVRNVALLLAAVLATAAALDATPLARLRPSDGDALWWVLGAVLVAAVVATVVPRDTGSPGSGPDGVRGIPYLPVQHPDGTTTTLPELASLRAQLLVHLSESCGRCARVSEVIAAWPAQVPDIDVRVLVSQPPGPALPAAWPGVLHDPDHRVASVLGLAHPSAVLLGADALIAGGPVHGADAVLELFAEVREALARA